MTPAYKKKYAGTFDKLVRPNAAKVRAKVEAEVKASGVSHADADRVNVLVYVNQTTTSTANGGEPQLALNRVSSRWCAGRHLAGRRHHVLLRFLLGDPTASADAPVPGPSPRGVA